MSENVLSEIDVIIHALQIRKLCKSTLFLQWVSNCLTFNLFLLNTKNTGYYKRHIHFITANKSNHFCVKLRKRKVKIRKAMKPPTHSWLIRDQPNLNSAILWFQEQFCPGMPWSSNVCVQDLQKKKRSDSHLWERFEHNVHYSYKCNFLA